MPRIGARDGFRSEGVRLEAYRVETLPRRGRGADIGVCDVRGVLEVTDGKRFLARVLAGFRSRQGVRLRSDAAAQARA